MEDEVLLKTGANMWRGKEAVGGWITLTRTNLHFESHAMNVQNGPSDIPIASIAEVRPVNTLGIVPNGMEVTLRDGTRERFVVFKRKALVEAIQRLLAPPSPT